MGSKWNRQSIAFDLTTVLAGVGTYNRPDTDPSTQKKNTTTHCSFGSGPQKDGFASGYCPTWFEHQPGSEYRRFVLDLPLKPQR